MNRFVQFFVMVLSVAIIAVVHQAPASASTTLAPCYACAVDCTPQGAQVACNADCFGLPAMYCLGQDQWGFCSGEPPYRQTVIQCGS